MKKNNLFVISTINVLDNYGNRLQNYALQETLKQYAAVKTSVRIYRATNLPSYLIQFIKKKFFNGTKQIIDHLLHDGVLSGIAFWQRIHRGKKFNKTYIDGKGGLISAYKVSMPKGYKNIFYVLGSDQIWNFDMLGVSDKQDILVSFGSFAKSGHVIAYAASFGVSKVRSEISAIIKEGLDHVSEIGIREDAGQKIIDSISGRQSTVVLDPTLLLRRTQWEGLILDANLKQPSKKYVLMQFLGELSNQQIQEIRKYAIDNDCEIKSFTNMSDFDTEAAGPLEFLNLILHADMIFTDSFHATCFSIIFEKQFKVYDVSYKGNSPDTNSRIKSLLNQLGIGYVAESKQIERVDYSQVSDILEKKRSESLKWLDCAISSIVSSAEHVL